MANPDSRIEYVALWDFASNETTNISSNIFHLFSHIGLETSDSLFVCLD